MAQPESAPSDRPTPADPGATADDTLNDAAVPGLRRRHDERLTVAWWMWPAALGSAALLAAELYLGAPGLKTWVPYGVLLPLTALGLWRLGRIRVTVTGGEFRVDDAHLPVRYIADITTLDPGAKRDVLGPHAEPYAFVVQRPWVPGAVQIHLADPADPTPYWVISTRRPAALAAALLAERGGVPVPTPSGPVPTPSGPAATPGEPAGS